MTKTLLGFLGAAGMLGLAAGCGEGVVVSRPHGGQGPAQADSGPPQGGGGSGGGGAADAGAGPESQPADRAPAAEKPSGGSCAPPPDLAMCTSKGMDPKILGVRDFFEWINSRRAMYGAEGGYGFHIRWKGFPWKGESHEKVTFPIRFAWDDDLACRAQAEAERLAKGGAPAGERVKGQNGCCGDMWIDGINTADWKIASLQWPNDGTYDWQDHGFGLTQHNGAARMALYYHDFGGDGPAIKRLGIGAAVTGDCVVQWVLQFGP